MRLKLYLIFLIISVLALSVVAGSMLIPASDKAKQNSKAPEKSPVISVDDWSLDRVDFIHYAKPEKPGKPPKGGGTGEDKCYKLMRVKWKNLPVTYTINPTNPQLL